jgi:hypothetical protein
MFDATLRAARQDPPDAGRGRNSLRESADAFVQPQFPAARFCALGCFAFASHFPDHRLAAETSTRVPIGLLHCHVCGLYGGPRGDMKDLNILSFILSFERFEWAGVRHTDPLYCAFDLAQFEIADRLVQTEEDFLILAKIIRRQTLSINGMV